jgi:hypothetical protein
VCWGLRGETQVRVYAPPGLSEQGRFALEVATKTLAYFAEYFGEPYPLPKMDLVAVPDFAAGAMENWCGTHRPSIIGTLAFDGQAYVRISVYVCLCGRAPPPFPSLSLCLCLSLSLSRARWVA